MKRIFFMLVAGAAWAGAHDGEHPKRDRLVVSASAVKLAVDYAVPPRDAATLKQMFAARKTQLAQYLVQQATHFVVLTVDGARQPLKIEQVSLFDLGVHVELGARLTSPPHKLRLEDRHRDKKISVPVEVSLEGLEAATPLPPQPFVFADHPLQVDLK